MANNINVTNSTNKVTITNNNPSNIDIAKGDNTVTIDQSSVKTININTAGPQGVAGPQGSPGTPGSVTTAVTSSLILTGSITASGGISASSDIITSNITAKRWNSPAGDTTNIQFLNNTLVFQANSEANSALVLNSAGALFNSANDANRDFKIGTGTTDDFLVVDSGDDTLTIAGNITASGNISASGDIFVTNINPDGNILNIGSTSNPGILHIQGNTQTGVGAGSPHLKLEGQLFL